MVDKPKTEAQTSIFTVKVTLRSFAMSVSFFWRILLKHFFSLSFFLFLSIVIFLTGLLAVIKISLLKTWLEIYPCCWRIINSSKREKIWKQKKVKKVFLKKCFQFNGKVSTFADKFCQYTFHQTKLLNNFQCWIILSPMACIINLWW